MGTKTNSKTKLFWGALLGTHGVGIGVTVIYFCVLTNIADVFTIEFPMVEIASKISKVVQFGFAIVLFAQAV